MRIHRTSTLVGSIAPSASVYGTQAPNRSTHSPRLTMVRRRTLLLHQTQGSARLLGRLSRRRTPHAGRFQDGLLRFVFLRVVIRLAVLQRQGGDETDHTTQKDVHADHVRALGRKRRLEAGSKDVELARPQSGGDVRGRTTGDDRGQLVTE